MKGNKNIENLTPYKIVSQKAWNSDNKESIIKLDWNESSFQIPNRIREKVKESLESDKLNWYPDVNNIKLLSLLSKYSNVSLENILYFGGSDAAHECIVKAMCNEGDEGCIIVPTYDNFRLVYESQGVTVNYFFLSEVDGNFILDITALDIFIKAKAIKSVYICTPNNPTCNVVKTEDVDKLINSNPDTLFIIDEAYYEFDGETCSGLVENTSNLIVTRTLSKAFSLASFRFGYIFAPKNLIEILSKIRNPKSISLFAQIAAMEALNDTSYVDLIKEEVNVGKELLINYLKNRPEIKLFYGGGNFILLRFLDKKDKEFVNFLESKNIFVRSYGHLNKMENCVRITIGTKREIEILISVLNDYNG
jgi:histidinol-phosphate aminotransferase